MNKFTKRIIPTIVAIVLCLSLMAPAFATESDVDTVSQEIDVLLDMPEGVEDIEEIESNEAPENIVTEDMPSDVMDEDITELVQNTSLTEDFIDETAAGTKVSSGGQEYLYDPSSGQYLPVRDVRDEIATEKVEMPSEDIMEQRREVLTQEATTYTDTMSDDSPADVPGGVGYGVFFNSDFRDDYSTGTSISYDIICPTTFGGDSEETLYLTSTNRAAKGVEALIYYYGQSQFSFWVYDWARDDGSRFQAGISADTLLSTYVRTKEIYGETRQYLTVQNTTVQIGTNQWANYVWLNCIDGTFDLVYSYTYTATLSEQQGQWVGSWGPIVETFQDSYSGTNTVGFVQTFLRSKDDSNWTTWEYLVSSQSYIRDDNKGFNLIFLFPNHGFAVNS